MLDRNGTNGRSASDVTHFRDFRLCAQDSLLDALRGTPYHQWGELRSQVAPHASDSFAAAERLVRGEWSEEHVRAQIRAALTAAATEIVLAMPDTAGGPAEIEARLARASEAVQAAQRLSPSAGLHSVA